jgi:glycosyltransferase involved in cell wall biosynthesis
MLMPTGSGPRRASSSRRPRVLIIVQNLPVPLDRRVWLEARALVERGYVVSVISPRGDGQGRSQVVDDVEIHTYPNPPRARGLASYVIEFVYCWLQTARLTLQVRRRRGFDVIQACNPPDTYWLLALLWRFRGVRFVYDQHDLNPELFRSRFGEPQGLSARLQHRALLFLEQMTYRVADRVISTNESYRAIALDRGRRRPEDVTVVRSGPDTTQMRPVVPQPDLRGDAQYLLAYLGIMGPQDGVDQLLFVMDDLVHRRGRRDIRLALLGFGDCLEDLRAQSTRLGLDDHVVFTGHVGPPEIARWLSTADVGLGPDLKTPLNDLSTMNKIMEYMAYCLPSVSFDLKESMASAGDTGVFVPSGNIGAFAAAVEALLADPVLRVEMGLAARRRAVAHLDWSGQVDAYVRVYDELLGPVTDPPDPVPADTEPPLSSPWTDGMVVVDLADRDALTEFVRDRARPPRVFAPALPS